MGLAPRLALYAHVAAVVLLALQMPSPEGAIGRTSEIPRAVGMSATSDLKRLALLVRPQIMIARNDIHVEVRIARHTDNRLLVVAWDGGSAGQFREQLDGDGDTILHERWLRSQPPANYLFVASLFAETGKIIAREEARIRVPEDSDR